MVVVGSGRGVAALAVWAVQSYVARGYVTARPIGPQGLNGRLYAACMQRTADRPWLDDFVSVTRESSFLSLTGVALL